MPDADSVDSSSVVSCDSLISIEDSDSDNSDNPSLISNTPVEPDGCDYGLNGDNLDWLKRPSIYSKDQESESVHWFNLLAYDNRVADWNLSDEEPIRNIMELPNSSFLPSPEEHAKLNKKICASSASYSRKELQVFQTVWQYDTFSHSSPIQHQHEQAVPNCWFKRLLPSII